MDVIDKFIVTYQQERSQWERLKDCAIEICNDGLEGIGVMGNVTGRVKSEDSLKKKLESRKLFKEYRDQNSIMNDQLDFVGLRIALYFPHQKQDVIQMLKDKFHYEFMRPFDRNWKPFEPGIYQNLFGQYVADHVWVCLHENDRGGVEKHSSHKFEIQLRSVLMDAWAGISHDLEYKALSGDPTGTELKLLDALKGHVEVGELMLEQLHRVHRRRVETENEPILSSREVGEILVDYVPENQVSKANMGELDSLLVVLRGIGANTPWGFRDLLRKHEIKKKLGASMERFQRDFQPVPTTVVFCLLEMVLPNLSTQEQQFREVTATIRMSQDRAWYDSRYWQPLIWLSRELVSSAETSSMSLTASQVHKYAHIWGAEHYVRSQTPITLDDDCVIDCLSRTHERSAPGIEFVAELCILGLAPTAPEYMEEHDEDDNQDDRFQVIAAAMRRAYDTDAQAWTQAIYDYSVSLRDYGTISTYKFFHSADVCLWLMSLDESDLLVGLLKDWPLKGRPYSGTNESLEEICDLAEKLQNRAMIGLLKGEINGFHMLDMQLLEGYRDNKEFKIV
jgi:ppGpp synthetase/RelA/SpoT-type nucleotidyltranferase